jgi:hypothetical protein
MESSAKWQAIATLYAWLNLVLHAIKTTPQAGFKCKSHNLRKGVASAASCNRAPFPVVKCMGDWAKKSSVTDGKYIDLTLAPSQATWRFFGWLTPSAHHHEDLWL